MKFQLNWHIICMPPTLLTFIWTEINVTKCIIQYLSMYYCFIRDSSEPVYFIVEFFNSDLSCFEFFIMQITVTRVWIVIIKEIVANIPIRLAHLQQQNQLIFYIFLLLQLFNNYIIISIYFRILKQDFICFKFLKM